MYPVPEPCTQNVVPILAADLVEIAADLAAKSAAISTRSAARIGTTFWVHGSGTGYMGSVHGTWVRYIVHGHGAYSCCNGTRCYSTLERARVHLRFVPLR